MTSSRGYAAGAFMQGSFRSNYMIIGYPVLLNLFGDDIVVNMAVVTLIVIPFFNIFSIIALTPAQEHNSIKQYGEFFLKVLTNPLIAAIVLGFFASAIGVKFPIYLDKFITMTGNLATPLALVAIGAFFHFDDFKGTLRNAILAVGLKLLVLPLIMTFAAYAVGLSPMNVILVAVLFGGPTAVSSFAMSSEMGGDAVLSGNIVILSSGLCVVSYMIILTFWLNMLGLA